MPAGPSQTLLISPVKQSFTEILKTQMSYVVHYHLQVLIPGIHISFTCIT